MKAMRDFHDAQDSIQEMLTEIENNIQQPVIRFDGENRKMRRERERQERKMKNRAQPA